MPILLTTGVPSGTTVYAIITNSLGDVWLGSAFGQFVSQVGAAILLAESPSGSGRHSAAFPVTQTGSYACSYFVMAGASPAASDECYGSETITVGTGTLNVVLEPVFNPPLDPIYTNGEVQVYQGASGVIGVDVNDAEGPVALPASPTFTVYKDTFPQTQTVFSVVAATTGNTATVTYTSGHTANAGRFRYQLVAGDGTILATGLFVIRPTV